MLNFNKYVHDGEEFVREIAQETDTPWDTIRAFRLMRAVLHALRDRLTPAHSLQVVAQLPMLLKAVYVDGWKISPGKMKSLRHMNDFTEAVREAGGGGLVHEFSTDYEVKKAVEAVFNVLKRRISNGEIMDMAATLPKELRSFLIQPEKTT